MLAMKMGVHEAMPDSLPRFRNRAPNVNSRLAAKG
jgi:hypothetical protein